jgi:hypothetical protein
VVRATKKKARRIYFSFIENPFYVGLMDTMQAAGAAHIARKQVFPLAESREARLTPKG